MQCRPGNRRAPPAFSLTKFKKKYTTPKKHQFKLAPFAGLPDNKPRQQKNKNGHKIYFFDIHAGNQIKKPKNYYHKKNPR
ncbi:hypothetical protein, partial [Enterobacter hormaechei]